MVVTGRLWQIFVAHHDIAVGRPLLFAILGPVATLAVDSVPAAFPCLKILKVVITRERMFRLLAYGNIGNWEEELFLNSG
jgi:hypothetical protein